MAAPLIAVIRTVSPPVFDITRMTGTAASGSNVLSDDSATLGNMVSARVPPVGTAVTHSHAASAWALFEGPTSFHPFSTDSHTAAIRLPTPSAMGATGLGWHTPGPPTHPAANKTAPAISRID